MEETMKKKETGCRCAKPKQSGSITLFLTLILLLVLSLFFSLLEAASHVARFLSDLICLRGNFFQNFIYQTGNLVFKYCRQTDKDTGRDGRAAGL